MIAARSTRAATGLVLLLLVTGTAASADNFGAIAYSPQTGAYGYSYDYDSRSAAETVAMQNCNANGRGCEVALWFRNSCGALATGANGGWGSAWADSRGAAEAAAINYCSGYTSGCRVLVWSCTTR